MKNNFLEIGKAVNTHGLRGDLKVLTWTDYPEVFEELKNVYINGEKHKISYVKYQKNNIILKLVGINSIEEAEKYKGKTVCALKSDFPSLDDGSYFVADLIGLNVFCGNEKLGILSEVIPISGADVYVIKPDKGKDILLPATKENILEINIKEKYVNVSIPEGLLD